MIFYKYFGILPIVCKNESDCVTFPHISDELKVGGGGKSPTIGPWLFFFSFAYINDDLHICFVHKNMWMHTAVCKYLN